ncbi:helix-turn-helix domain-containing protein [Sporosarcina ureae]|uniref:helix-turn-helix domain-containing protein n=1 Tax=Sporosarcina ureae TaxID=1571 RepID=UPI0026F2494A|nr:helix-turn-helix transcriptional regulator [Sporosarcina ureae]
MNEFGNCLRKLRTQGQMSLRYLAERANLSYSFIDSLEKGRYKPTREAVYTLSEELKTDANMLMKLAGYAPDEKVD